MRSIDADALIAQMEADAEQFEDTMQKVMYYAAISDVKHQPTITQELIDTEACASCYRNTIEPERETGKWEIYVISGIDGEGCRCTKCRFEGVPYWDFCPNCGARMGE